jgi:hypothetical protein
MTACVAFAGSTKASFLSRTNRPLLETKREHNGLHSPSQLPVSISCLRDSFPSNHLQNTGKQKQNAGSLVHLSISSCSVMVVASLLDDRADTRRFWRRREEERLRSPVGRALARVEPNVLCTEGENLYDGGGAEAERSG